MTHRNLILLPLVSLSFVVSAAYASDFSSSQVDTGDSDQVRTTQIDRIHVENQNPGQPGTVVTNPGTTVVTPGSGDSVGRTVITEKQKSSGGLRDEAVGIKPQVGFLSLGDNLGGSSSRAVGGLTVDVNFLRRLNTEGGRPYFGMSVGALYSHVGASGADFFGMNSPSGNNSGTNFLQLPIDLKAGYTVSDIFRPSLHVGANVLYNNTSVTTTLANSTTSSWSTHPNIGLDLEFGVGKGVGVLLRPDWTLGADNSIFTGTFGLVFPIS